jgi:NADPH:quinone reductase-like Zn-dependent oxidoreductase
MLAQRVDTNPGAILGFDFAGIVEKLGPNVTTENIYVGQRVSGMVYGGK